MSTLHKPGPHESGQRHANGAALYVDDLPPPHGMLLGHTLTSPVARGKITRVDISKALTAPGIHAVLLARDIPGHNNVGPIFPDEPLLAETEVFTVGQVVALIVGETYAQCRAAARLVVLEIAEQKPILTIEEAEAANAYIGVPHVMLRGDVDAALAASAIRVKGEYQSHAQDHFYLETHASLAIPEENNTFRVHSSTQHPSEVQAHIASILHVGRSQVVVEAPRMGGGFGGKETQAANYAALAALGAMKTGRPVKVWLNRDEDMIQTGKRHPVKTVYEAGFTADGMITALKARLTANGGWSADLSPAILDRAMFHIDSAYYLPTLRIEGVVARTNLPSNTAFRGFGGPQGMLVMEDIISRVAERLRLDPAELRRKNYYGDAPRNVTQFGQDVTQSRLPRIHADLMKSSGYEQRRQELDAYNAKSPHVKRGIGFQPVKFGISFTNTMLNQAGALVLIYGDGTVQMNHGGTEMGQGLHSKMLAVCSHELGVKLENIRAMTTATDKVPNTSATAASAGTDLNGQAVLNACVFLRQRLQPVAAKLLSLPVEEAHRVHFDDGEVFVAGSPERIPFRKVVERAYLDQVSLSATGYYRTPDIHYDRSQGKGRPFHYFAYGGAVIEVEVHGLTGEHRILRADILHDVGDSLIPSIDRGQVEGGFIQGVGWLTCEEVLFDGKGQLLTHSPSTYKIPAVGEAPDDFRVELLQGAPQSNVIHGSKAVGEPPLMLALGVVTALRHAVAGFGPGGKEVNLRVPCTPENVLRAIMDIRTR